MTEQKPRSVAETAQELRTGLNSVFDESLDTVKKNATMLEEQYFTPASEKVQRFVESNPVVSTFLAVFGFLSFIPIALAVGFIAFSVSLLLTGLSIFFGSVLVGILFVTSLALTPILIITATISLFTTGFLVALFLSTRLFVLVRKNDSVPAGMGEWMDETKTRVLQTIPRQFINEQQSGGSSAIDGLVFRGEERENGEVEIKSVQLQLGKGNGTFKQELSGEIGLRLDGKQEKPIKNEEELIFQEVGSR